MYRSPVGLGWTAGDRRFGVKIPDVGKSRGQNTHIISVRAFVIACR
jgi:hypothetical protein